MRQLAWCLASPRPRAVRRRAGTESPPSESSEQAPDVERRREDLRARRRLAASLALMSLLGWSLVLVASALPPSQPTLPSDATLVLDTDRAMPESSGRPYK